MASARDNAQHTINALNDEIKKMAQEIEREQGARDTALEGKAEAEKALQTKIDRLSTDLVAARKNAEEIVKEKNFYLEGMNAQIKKANANAVKEAEENARLREDLERAAWEMKDLEGRADTEIKKRDDDIREKEGTLSELERKNRQLLGDIENARIQSEHVAKSTGYEIQSLQMMVSNLTGDLDKEVKLRQDVLAGKEGLESMHHSVKERFKRE